jgi:hypothetical protein
MFACTSPILVFDGVAYDISKFLSGLRLNVSVACLGYGVSTLVDTNEKNLVPLLVSTGNETWKGTLVDIMTQYMFDHQQIPSGCSHIGKDCLIELEQDGNLCQEKERWL